MLQIGEAVDDGDIGPSRQLRDIAVLEGPDNDAVKIPRKRPPWERN